ncbi:MAG: antibiotic biosynthesis monooxygenase family protein [Desulfobacteraceae bacterium]
MQVTVMITWKLKENKTAECYKVIFNLRASVMSQRGYISSETLQDHDDPSRVTVLSKWTSIEGWNEWVNSPERKLTAAQIEDCLASPPEYKIFSVLKLTDKLKG